MMQKSSWLFPYLLRLMLVTLATASQSQTIPTRHTPHKRALLIGINAYYHGNRLLDYPNSNCGNDVKQIKQVLVNRFGFHNQNMVTLTSSEQTTRQSLMDALDKFAQDSDDGDVIYIHISGVSSRILKSTKTDSFEAALVPSDYVSKNDHSKDVRYSILRHWLLMLKQKNPASIFISLDATFPGNRREQGQLAVELGAGRVPTSASGSRLIFLTSCHNDKHDKVNKDVNGTSLGAFAYYLVRELNRVMLGPQMTYRDLHERMQADLSGIEFPQISGNIDTVVFKDEYLPPAEPFVSVTGLDSISHTAVLWAGHLEDVSIGSKFALYPSGTKEFAHTPKVAEAVVTDVNLSQAFLRLTHEIPNLVIRRSAPPLRAVEVFHQ